MTLQDITDRVYDTLMNNKPDNQLDLSHVSEQEVDACGGLIIFDYNDQTIKINVSIIK